MLLNDGQKKMMHCQTKYNNVININKTNIQIKLKIKSMLSIKSLKNLHCSNVITISVVNR